ncbi:MAG: hypothetical protein ACTS5F_01800 [Candidatus Hodgkinia cicadicola]
MLKVESSMNFGASKVVLKPRKIWIVMSFNKQPPVDLTNEDVIS